MFDALDIKWSGKQSLAVIKGDWQLVVKLPTSNGTKATYFISEAAMYKLAF